MDEKGTDSFKNEVKIMLYLNGKIKWDGTKKEKEDDTHPSIVKMFHYFEDARRYLLVLSLIHI